MSLKVNPAFKALLAQGWQGVLFGLKPYEEVWALQKELVALRQEGRIGNLILVGQHPPCFTVGRGFKENLQTLGLSGLPCFSIERGGGLTWHTVGQLVVYPIFELPKQVGSSVEMLRALEQSVLTALAFWGLQGEQHKGETGVWLPSNAQFNAHSTAEEGEPRRKVASVGLALRRWVTFHGLAFNLNNDLSWIQQVQPCGLPASTYATLQQLWPAGEALCPAYTELEATFLKQGLEKVFGEAQTWQTLEAFYQEASF